MPSASGGLCFRSSWRRETRHRPARYAEPGKRKKRPRFPALSGENARDEGRRERGPQTGGGGGRANFHRESSAGNARVPTRSRGVSVIWFNLRVHGVSTTVESLAEDGNSNSRIKFDNDRNHTHEENTN